MLTLERDAYGPYAQASLLADYAELLALKGQPASRADIADFLSDNDWCRLERVQSAKSRFDDDEKSVASLDQCEDADDAASIVFDQIDERLDVLADLYPFVITNDALSIRSDLIPDSCPFIDSNPYIAMLMLTVAHAFRVKSGHTPHELFERIVTDVLRDRGLDSTGLAAHRRKLGSFDAALQAACGEVGLEAAPNAAPRLTEAHDEGVDVLGHLGWEKEKNLRPGTWGFIGQVTVGKSDSWKRKIKEPSPQPWAKRLGTWIQPLPFLAVPHHVESVTMEMLTSEGQAIVLDRLRLVRFKSKNGDEEREIIRAVAAQEVEPLTG